MVESTDPKNIAKPPMRCTECDREMEHYNVWLKPSGERVVICWECKAREEKGFFNQRGFHRGGRGGYIPR